MSEIEESYCAHCGAALMTEFVAGRERPICSVCRHIVFRNPKPVGLAVTERDDHLLLIRRGNAPLQGYWAPPGGHVEMGESVKAATIREIREEAGVDVVLDDLVGVYSHEDVEVVIIVYRGRIVAGTARAGEDALEVGLFAPEEIPVQSLPENGSALDHWFYGVVQSILGEYSSLPNAPELNS